jgi:hypothetical protein
MKTLLPPLDGIAGAAFLLRTPARKSLTLQHNDGVVTIREGGEYALVQLFSSLSDGLLRIAAWRVIQEAFDIHAATHREAFATRRGEREHLLWTRTGDGYRLTCVETMDMPWSMTANAVTSGPVAIARAIPYHPSFRFYRLSQLTDDLFDAYRNAYLCLECIVSSESAKMPGEKELNWLKRVLGGPLLAAVPGGMDVNEIATEVYKSGRLPLFHAKTGESFYAPQGDERERVQLLLDRLSALLAGLLRHKFGDCFPGGWGRMSQGAIDAQARAVLPFDEVVYKHENKRISIPSAVEVISSPRRFGNPWARTEVVIPPGLGYIDGVELFRKGEYWAAVEFPECLPMENVAVVSMEFSYLSYNIRAPNPSHSM